MVMYSVGNNLPGYKHAVKEKDLFPNKVTGIAILPKFVRERLKPTNTETNLF